MAAPVIAELPEPPVRSDAPVDFALKADLFLGSFPWLREQINTTAAWINGQAGTIATHAANAANDAATASAAGSAATTAAGTASASATAATNAATAAGAAKVAAEDAATRAEEAAEYVEGVVGPLGTAATKDVTTSAQDVTPGRVIKVGDYGLPADALYKALPAATAIDSATDLNTITKAGWFGALLGAAAGSRNANHPDGQTALAAGNGVVNYYWVFVSTYGSNVLQWAAPYISGANTTLATPKFRMLGGGTWTPWYALQHGGNQLALGTTPTSARGAIQWWAGVDKIVNVAAATGAVALDLSAASIFTLTLSGNTTLSVTNLPALSSEARSIVVRVSQGATAYSLAWWGGITWLATLTPAAPGSNKTQEYVLTWDGAGWIGRKGAGN